MTTANSVEVFQNKNNINSIMAAITGNANVSATMTDFNDKSRALYITVSLTKLFSDDMTITHNQNRPVFRDISTSSLGHWVILSFPVIGHL